jgi:acyl transferase domain-containing protein
MSIDPQQGIAIVGLGALFPGSTDRGGFWRDILAGRDLITDVPASHWLVEDYYDADPSAPDKTYGKRGAFVSSVDFDPMEFAMPPNILPSTDTSQLLALMVAKQVLEDAANGQFAKMDRERISVILGVASTTELVVELGSRLQRPVWVKALREEGLPEDQVQAACDRIANSYVPWTESSFPGLLGNVVAGRIANRFDLGGTNCVIDAACASSLSALHLALLELHSGKSDLAIAGGVDTLNDILMYTCFSKTPALSPTGDCRPFSDQADGTILGEGLGMVALKRMADAERDGDRIYAVVRGLGTSSDGKSKSVYAPVSAGQARALRRAYSEAGYGPETVELVEAHGTATRAGDAAEFGGLREAFDGSTNGVTQWCALGSIKSQIGHTKAAAGAAGLFKAVMALHHKILPPTIKVDQPNPALELDSSPFYLNTSARPWVRDGSHPRRASVSSFGFGGSNYHVTLEEYTGTGKRRPRSRSAPAELVMLGAASSEALALRARSLAEGLPDGALQHMAFTTQREFEPGSLHRLAVVASSEAELRKLLGQAADRLASGSASSFTLPGGVYYGSGARPGGVALLFPGQGSQRLEMGADLAMAFDAARLEWDAAANLPFEGAPERLHQVVFPRPAFSDEVRDAQRARLTATEWAQPALAATSLSYLALLRQVGLRAEAVAGHSFGELSALHAAGVLEAEDLLRVARKRGELMAAASSIPGSMTAVTGALGDLVDRVAAAGIPVVAANHNGPHQVVFSGGTSAIEELERWLAEHAPSLSSQRLPVSTAFHSSLVAPSVEPFRDFLQGVRFSEPTVPVYANSTADRYPRGPDAIRQVLASQLSEPVRFADQIEAMYAAGSRVFVEVGPGGALTAMVERILGEREFIAVGVERKGQPGTVGLWHALGRLVAAGADLDVAALWEEYEVPSDPAARTRPKLTVSINGANYGKPYPPEGGASALPRPNTGGGGAKQAVAEQRSRENVEDAPAFSGLSSVARPGNSDGEFALARQAVAGGEQKSTGLAVNRSTTSEWGNGTNGRLHDGSGGRAGAALTSQDPAAGGDSSSPMTGAPAPAAAAATSPPAAAAPAHPTSAPQIESASPQMRALLEMHRETAQAHSAYLTVMAESHMAYLNAMGGGLAGAPVGHFGAGTASPLAPIGVHVPAGVEAPPAAGHGSDLQRTSGVGGAPSQLPIGVAPSHAPAASASPPSIAAASHTPVVSAVPPAVAAAPQAPAAMAAPRSVAAAVPVPRLASDVLAPTPAAAPAAPATPALDLEALLLSVVADKTGYPVEMLDLSLELESGLGIDSIKRVEILSALREQAPHLPEVQPSQLASLGTLAEIIAFMQANMAAETTAEAGARSAGSTGGSDDFGSRRSETLSPGAMGAAQQAAAPPSSASAPPSVGISVAELTDLLLAVVADKTGYPVEMLDPSLELESGLGIDSIKRVEILSALREQAPELPEVQPSQLASLGTLAEIIAFMGANGAGSGPADPPSGGAITAEPAFVSVDLAPALDLPALLIEIVADKTGYPAEMLDLSLELESGLGIDSIKRVEILSALRERAPGLPEVQPSQLASLGTLGEIITFMEQGGAPATAMPATGDAVEPPPPTPTGEQSSPTAPDQRMAASEAEAGANPVGRFAVRAIPAAGSGFAMAGLLSKGGEIAITDDGRGVAALLVARLAEFGVEARVVAEIPAGATGVVHLGGLRDARDENAALAVNHEVFSAARAVAERFAAEGGVFVTVQDTGGDFGLSGCDGPAVWTAGLAGLAKTAAREWPGASVKAIDLARAEQTPEELAGILATELLFGGPELEVGISPRLGRVTLAAETAEAPRGELALQAGDVLIATGGARGVTAACLKALAETVPLRIALLGRTPLEVEDPSLRGAGDEAAVRNLLIEQARELGSRRTPAELGREVAAIMAAREVAATIRGLEDSGSEVVYFACDAADSDAVAAVLDEVRSSWGRIDGILHGAGVIADKRIEQKTDEQFERVFAAKVGGLRSLLKATASDELKAILLFSSVAARTGNPGQSDYAMANEILNKVASAEAARRPGCVVRSLGWGPWDGGMVTPALRAHFEKLEVPLIPVAAGARAFVEEVRSGGQAELVIGGGSPDAGLDATPRSWSMEVLVDSRTYPTLASHRIEDVPVLPVVLVVEWFVRAAVACRPGAGRPRIRDVRVMRGVRLENFEGTGDRLILTTTESTEGGSASLRMELRGEAGALHYSGTAEFVGGEQRPPFELLRPPMDEWDLEAEELYDGRLFHGPDFQAIRKLDGVSAEGAAASLAGTLELGWSEGWRTDVVAMDGALQLARLWGIHHLGQASLPTRIGSITLHSDEPHAGPVQCVLRSDASRDFKTVSDISLFAAGRLIAEMEGVEMHLLQKEAVVE